MSCNWEKKKLRDVVELVIDNRGRNPKSYSEDGGIPVIDNYLIVSEAEVNLNEVKRYIDNETYNTFIRKHINGGDVLLTLVGNGYGKVAITPNERCAIIQNTIGLRCNKDNDNQYLYYLLRANRDSLMNLNRGAAQPSIKVGDVLNLEFNFPPVEIQKTTACLLGSIDKKILSNTQTNQTLEEMAQAIFKSWFVDFNPVKAKVNGEQPEGMDAATASLFPEKLVESELGLIPEGWKVSSLSELIKLTGGGTPKRSEETYWNGDIPWFSVKDVPSGSNVFVVDTDEKITELGLNKSSTKLLPKGTTIITARGTVGKLALVGTDMCMNQSCYGIRGKEVGDYYNYFNLKEAVSTLQRNTHGAVFDTITTKTFDTYSLAFGGVELANRFDDVIAPLLQKIESNVRQNIELSALRDTLLPKLLSGEVEFNEV
ncbi:restriction endonuclease subunit S [Vibrio parahaemolyticus]|nr:restriction endonuclease subunit S [Vibrio parahaemolyticus]